MADPGKSCKAVGTKARQKETSMTDHGISFRNAARVFFDYDRIEFYDEENSAYEDRFDTIGDLSAGFIGKDYSRGDVLIGNIRTFQNESEEIVFVVYTERPVDENSETDETVIRLISARLATNFERGLYYGKHD